MVDGIRDLMVAYMPQKSAKAYHDLGNEYQVYKPEIKLISPFCGDPLEYDLFSGKCSADSVCEMWTTVLPSTVNKVMFTMDVYNLVFVMAYLKTTPVAAR